METKNQDRFEALTAQLNEFLQRCTYEPVKATAYLSTIGSSPVINVVSLSTSAFHHLELCVDFARINYLTCYATLNNGKVIVRIS